jgi:hypothetical protein
MASLATIKGDVQMALEQIMDVKAEVATAIASINTNNNQQWSVQLAAVYLSKEKEQQRKINVIMHHHIQIQVL